jgi:site-specific recombinase XerD
VQKLLGHSSIKTTERYAHLDIKNLENALRTLDNPQTPNQETL